MKTIRIQVGKDMEQVLRALKARYPLLDNVEIIKLSLSEFYHDERKQPQDLGAQGLRSRLEQLPELTLTSEERSDITESIDEAQREKGVVLSIEHVQEHVRSRRKRS